jgi:Asp-tRNA(Asn)/Glu-tRNA(Gln) amidotransferase A subunit family amidase
LDPAALTVVDARAAIGAGSLSPVELLDAVLDRIRARNDELRAYLLVDDEGARLAAREAEGAAREGDRRPLLGIPVCVKDVIDVAGLPTTAGAAGWRREPPSDATAVARLRADGAVIVGKGNTNEFAYGIDGRNPHWGDARNPFDGERISGGSSAGPAVAVATGMALAGLGTDTTGSLRVPAALCGVVGLRPTHGAVPTDGVVPLAWSYDVVGPLARTVEDVALLWAVLAGEDAAGDARLPRTGLLTALAEGSEPAVAAGTRTFAEALDAEPVELPMLGHAEAIHTTVQMSEASAVHAGWFAQQRDRYSPPVRERLELGRTLPAIDYLRAQQARRVLVDEFAALMEDEGLAALLAPTTLAVAPRRDGDQAAQRPALLHAVLPLSQTAGPVLAVPSGVDDEGLPVGVQLAGRPGDEAALLGLAAGVGRSR